MVVSIKELQENKNGVETLFFPKTHADAVVYDSNNTVLDKIGAMDTAYTQHAQQVDGNIELLWAQWNDAISQGVDIEVTDCYARDLSMEELEPEWPWLIEQEEEEEPEEEPQAEPQAA